MVRVLGFLERHPIEIQAFSVVNELADVKLS